MRFCVFFPHCIFWSVLVCYILEINDGKKWKIKYRKNCQSRKKLYKSWVGDVDTCSKSNTFILNLQSFLFVDLYICATLEPPIKCARCWDLDVSPIGFVCLFIGAAFDFIICLCQILLFLACMETIKKD